MQEFARLNKQELLKETQVALCRLDLVQKQDDLINGRNRHKKLVKALFFFNKNGFLKVVLGAKFAKMGR